MPKSVKFNKILIDIIRYILISLCINGNPPALVQLGSNRLAVVYGYRAPPYGIRARLSGDGGESWAEEIILRDDALSWDMGYPRCVVRPDGAIATVYYFTTESRREQHIACTVWNPGDR